MNIKYTYIFFISCFLFFGSNVDVDINSENHIELITQKSEFTAGDPIVLEFISKGKIALQLYCSNSYGSTLLTAETENNKLSFKIPLHFSSKRGFLNWKLIAKETTLSGNIKIIPKATPISLETYIGPIFPVFSFNYIMI